MLPGISGIFATSQMNVYEDTSISLPQLIERAEWMKLFIKINKNIYSGDIFLRDNLEIRWSLKVLIFGGWSSGAGSRAIALLT